MIKISQRCAWEIGIAALTASDWNIKNSSSGGLAILGDSCECMRESVALLAEAAELTFDRPNGIREIREICSRSLRQDRTKKSPQYLRAFSKRRFSPLHF
jgi:hypothetical protein